MKGEDGARGSGRDFLVRVVICSQRRIRRLQCPGILDAPVARDALGERLPRSEIVRWPRSQLAW
eukprot:9145857-Pyramimonas_sp.AAC.1